VAVQVGMILAALLYIRRVTSTTTVAVVTKEYIEAGRAHSLQANEVPEGVTVYRIHGPFLFGATDKLLVIEDAMPELGKVVMLRLRNMTAIDGTGVHALESLAETLKKNGKQLVLCGLREQPETFIQRSDLAQKIGFENILPSLELGIARARHILAGEN